MQHVKWKYPKREDDHEIHFLKDAEYTLCGSAMEGELTTQIDYSHEAQNQGFVVTSEPVTCSRCIDIVIMCQRVRCKEFKH